MPDGYDRYGDDCPNAMFFTVEIWPVEADEPMALYMSTAPTFGMAFTMRFVR
jgi:hypothetical protein